MSVFVNALLELTSSMGYLGIFFLMTIESSFIPFPSEIVIPPAAYLASKGEMNIFLVVLFGIFGSLIGALINYYLAKWLGRPIIFALVEKRWAKFLLLSRAKVEKAERCFLNYGGISTFLGRLVPAIRQLISLPAGFSEMKLWRFLLFTFLGAGFWVMVLAILGWYFGENEAVFMPYLNVAEDFVFWGILIGVLGLLYYLIWKYIKSRKKRDF